MNPPDGIPRKRSPNEIAADPGHRTPLRLELCLGDPAEQATGRTASTLAAGDGISDSSGNPVSGAIAGFLV